jgi:hypothetical protein
MFEDLHLAPDGFGQESVHVRFQAEAIAIVENVA